MLLTREADYAFRCVLEVAGSGRLSAAKVAERQDISLTFLGKIVQSLARAGILATRRGVNGGMTLARPAESITLLEVIEAIEGPLVLNVCLTSPPQCDRIPRCPAYPLLCRAQEQLRTALDVSISDLMESARETPEVPAGPAVPIMNPDGRRASRRRRTAAERGKEVVG